MSRMSWAFIHMFLLYLHNIVELERNLYYDFILTRMM